MKKKFGRQLLHFRQLFIGEKFLKSKISVQSNKKKSRKVFSLNKIWAEVNSYQTSIHFKLHNEQSIRVHSHSATILSAKVL